MLYPGDYVNIKQSNKQRLKEGGITMSKKKDKFWKRLGKNLRNESRKVGRKTEREAKRLLVDTISMFDSKKK